VRLVDLDPTWVYDYNTISHAHRQSSDTHSVVHSPPGPDPEPRPETSIDLGRAQGVMFLCPTCFVRNKGPVGTESVLCWFNGRGIPAEALPGPGRWIASGTSFDDLTLSPSVNVDKEHWHGFITNGEVK
jgi:hypothetical protein